MSVDRPGVPPFDELLWELVRRTSTSWGEEFFRQLTRALAQALDMKYAFVSELVAPRRLHTLAIWDGQGWTAIEYDVDGTPCGNVVEAAGMRCYPRGVLEVFPQNAMLAEAGIESYLGTPLLSSTGSVIGNLCLLDVKPIEDEARTQAIVEPFASRAAAELERIRIGRELERQHAFLRQVLDIHPSLIFAKDRAGRFTLVNHALAEAYGGTIEGLIGKTDADFNPKAEEVEFFRKMDLEVMDTRQERMIAEEPLTDSTGRLRWVQTIKRPIVEPDGRVNQILGVATDITELKRTREELFERQNEEQRRVQAELRRVEGELVRQTRLATIGQVAASIAHDLRNPLGAINNAVFYLRRSAARDNPKWTEHLDIIVQEIQAADRIIGDLLEMSRPKTPVKEPVDLGVALRETFDRLRGGDRFELECRFDPDPFVVEADPVQLRRVLANLITNALQAQGPEGWIRAVASREAGWEVIALEDGGPGVTPEIREGIFEPLFTTKAKGTGLGLSICRQILEQHGGSIVLVPGRGGAVFEIRLPR